MTENSDVVRKQLIDLYSENWHRVAEVIPETGEYSNLFVVNVTNSYLKARKKLMVVGQETCGWFGSFEAESELEKIAWLQRGYAEFNFGCSYRSTPFWRTVHRLREAINPNSPNDCIVWSNINCVDKKRSRAEDIEGLLGDIGLLREEIRILEPEILIFLSGPNYDRLIEKQFPEMFMENCGEFPVRALARLVHPQLPRLTFRTYHPAYLQRSKKLNLLELIVRASTE